jgi:septum formation protein
MSAPAPDLVLASTSVYRRVLLERLGVPFRCRAPLCDESRLKLGESNPTKLAERLAHAKAASLVATEPGAAIIGCDQVVSFAGQAVGKPYTAAGAIDQLTALAGHAHDLITALAVIQGDRILRHTDVSRLRMRPLTRAAIERYVKADEPFDCAGSYKIEERGIALFEQIESNDHTAVTGLPLVELVSILRGLGLEIP